VNYLKTSLLLGTVACAVICVVGSSAMAKGKKMEIKGESLVLAKAIPGNLCFDKIVKGSVVIRTNFRADKEGTKVYKEGVDYIVDYANGTVTRTANSTIPDYSTNGAYGIVDFDHGKITNFSNHPFFIWVDYKTTNGKSFALSNDQTKVMANVRKKLEAGGPFKVVSYGDSIAAGGEASEPDLRFQARFGRYLQAKFPKSKVEVVDASISGYTSQQGIDWFDDPRYNMVNIKQADLVLLGFGMNDHNIPGFGTPVDKFKANFITIVKMLRERKGADVLIFSTMPPNENWHYGSHRMGEYAQAAKEAAEESKCGYADVYDVWKMVLKRKDQPSLLGNNINHPNDFGHWLYEQGFEAVKF